MNKIYFIIITILLWLSNCTTPKETKNQVDVKIKNLSEKNLMVYLYVYSPSWTKKEITDSCFLSFNDSTSFHYESIGTYRNNYIGIGYMPMYSLNDTSFFDFISFKYYESDRTFSIYQSSFMTKDSINHSFHSFVITNELLTLFQKDTSMLTKFKDYYNK